METVKFATVAEVDENFKNAFSISPKEPNLPERAPSLATMEALLLEWKERLGLQEWNLTFFWAKNADQDSQGTAKFNPAHRQGVIMLLAPDQESDYASTIRWPEVVLVHELLHVRWH